jgi:hypothetical protein
VEDSSSSDKRDSSLSVLPLDAKFLGESLSPISTELILSAGHNLEEFWFHSPRNLDLFIWRDEQQVIIKQQLCFMGVLAEWNIVEGSKTGVVQEEEGSQRISGSSLLEYDAKTNPVTLEQASQICHHIRGLDESLKKDVIDNWLGRRPSYTNPSPSQPDWLVKVWRWFKKRL